MKTLFLAIITVASFGIPALANNSDLETLNTTFAYLRSQRITPCRSWRPVRNGFGYSCSSPGVSIQVTEHRSLERVITDLENRIITLENRLRDLERR